MSGKRFNCQQTHLKFNTTYWFHFYFWQIIFQTIEILVPSNNCTTAASFCRVWAQFKDVTNSPEVQVLRKGMQRRGAGGFPWSRESLIFSLCSFHFGSLPLLSTNNFCVSSGQTFCPASLNSQCQWVYWTQVGKNDWRWEMGRTLFAVRLRSSRGRHRLR